MIVIGLTGRARSGKDTVADYLVEKHGFEKASFAGPLKQVARAVNPILGMDVRHPGHLIRMNEALEYLTEDQVKELYPEYRRFLQTLGTDGIRAIDPEFWVNAAVDQVRRTRKDRVVFTDTRFMNECQAIWRKMRGPYDHTEVWHVARPSLPELTEDAHISEHNAGQFGENVWLNNSQDLDHLFQQVEGSFAETKYAAQVKIAA